MLILVLLEVVVLLLLLLWLPSRCYSSIFWVIWDVWQMFCLNRLAVLVLNIVSYFYLKVSYGNIQNSLYYFGMQLLKVVCFFFKHSIPRSCRVIGRTARGSGTLTKHRANDSASIELSVMNWERAYEVFSLICVFINEGILNLSSGGL